MKFLFGGKGGVGKTTISATFALMLAKTRPTLLISSDPAHSLSDIFGQPIGSSEKKIVLPAQFTGELRVLELDVRQSLDRYKESTRKKLANLNVSFDFDFDKYIDKLSATPGAYENALFDQFADLLLSNRDLQLVFDTAPTGETLHLIQSADLIDQWIEIIISAREGVLKLKKLYNGSADDAIIDELREMKNKFQGVARILRQPQTHLIFVMTPEKLALEETRRSFEILHTSQIPVRGLIVNRILPDELSAATPYLKHQKKYLRIIREKWHDLILGEIPWWREEPEGLSQLIPFAENLCRTKLGAFIK